LGRRILQPRLITWAGDVGYRYSGQTLEPRPFTPAPPTISFEQMTGFSLFMLKAVLSGRGDEIIDLAKVNLFR
jgi:hypothetical protein